MGKRPTADHGLNILSLTVSIIVFGTGLILLFKFHVGSGAHRTELFGLSKGFWVGCHQAAAIGFLVCSVAHIQRHWKYVKTVVTRWRANLPKKTKATTREQVLLCVAALIVLWAGFYGWIAFPDGTLDNEDFHKWIDVHNRIGVLLLIGMGVHIKRRWRRVFASHTSGAHRGRPSVVEGLEGGKNGS